MERKPERKRSVAGHFRPSQKPGMEISHTDFGQRLGIVSSKNARTNMKGGQNEACSQQYGARVVLFAMLEYGTVRS